MTLAHRLRPQRLDQVIGQTHLIGDGKPLTRMVQAGALQNMILYGPPGTGKTSIASALAGSLDLPFETFNASTDKKSDLQALAKKDTPLVLLLDEIHRLTKPIQDYLLSFMESGAWIIIGATTENPYLSLSPALRSRSVIFEVTPVDPDTLTQYLQDLLDQGILETPAQVSSDLLAYIGEATHGDVRAAINLLEVLTQSAETGDTLTPDDAAPFLTQQPGDKDGDTHYDLLSAFQKSIRGSDVNAALHYLSRLVTIGDLLSITRRLQVIAYEDIGVADPIAPIAAVTACQTALAVGFPEARIPLSVAVVELCHAPKSNLAYHAFNQAQADLGRTHPIPNHLKDAHYKGAEDLGHGVDYKYPHAYPYHIVSQAYLPESLHDREYLTDTVASSRRDQDIIERAHRFHESFYP